jgi:clan AA aspartic protease
MDGIITADRAAALRLKVRGPSGVEQEVETVLDTGFNGYLTLPHTLVVALGLAYHSEAIATLADGSRVRLRKYTGTVIWDGQERDVIVLEAEGGPLVGMSLLYGSRVTLDVVDGGPVIIEPLPGA